MQDVYEKAKKIRLAIFDVDGVLTNGWLFYGEQGSELKVFHVHDGQGLKFLQQAGIEIAIITAKQSTIVEKRMKDLGITHIYQGNIDKLPAYEELKKRLSLTDEQISYVGDDLPDLPLLRRVGLAVTVPNAPLILQKHAAWITKANGGHGAVREVCDVILQAQGLYDQVIQPYVDR